MGLGGLLKKLSGAEPKGGNAFNFVFAADKRFVRRNMELQGTHEQDNANRMAYFCSPDSNGILSRIVNGVERILGPVNVAFEVIPELYRFPYLDWAPDRVKDVGGDGKGDNGHHAMYELDPILDNGFSDGFNLAAQKQENTELRNRLLQILLLAVLLSGALFLMVAASTGVLSDFISNAGKFFGGG